MHNKLLIADGVMAIAGGRNIGDAYFMLDQSSNFVDMDAFIMGAVIRQLQHIFDRYWNSEVVFPVQALVEPQRAAGTAGGGVRAADHAGPPATGTAARWTRWVTARRAKTWTPDASA